MKITNVLGLPDALVRAVSNDPYDPGTCQISVTKLISPVQKVALELLHADEITEDVSSRMFSLFGQCVHTILSRAEVEAISEKRLEITRQGWRLSGALDRLVISEGILQDYKVTGANSLREGNGRAEWQSQLNILATLLREHGYTVNRLQVICILRDWQASHARSGGNYPQNPVVVLDIPMWDPERCEMFIDERIRLHQAAREAAKNGKELQECSPEERWAKADTWAVKKDRKVRAVRVFQNEADAWGYLEIAGPKHSVQHRPGLNVRCSGFCPAAKFCQQHLKSGGKAEVADEADPG
ncbi:MAG: hypothetical protein V1897_01220 [Pseudomonadota bacterium]